jgi:hypothetical protein
LREGAAIEEGANISRSGEGEDKLAEFRESMAGAEEEDEDGKSISPRARAFEKDVECWYQAGKLEISVGPRIRSC